MKQYSIGDREASDVALFLAMLGLCIVLLVLGGGCAATANKGSGPLFRVDVLPGPASAAVALDWPYSKTPGAGTVLAGHRPPDATVSAWMPDSPLAPARRQPALRPLD